MRTDCVPTESGRRLEHAGDQLGRFVVHRRRNVGVRAQRDGDGGVPEPFLHDPGVHTGPHGERCPRVTQAVQWDHRQAPPCGAPLKLPRHPVRMQRAAVDGEGHEAVVGASLAQLTQARAFGLGLTVTAIESTTAIPYLGAVAAISRADPPVAAIFALLLAYKLVFVAPPILLALTAPYTSGNLLDRLSTRRPSRPGLGRTVLRVVCGLIGIVLLVDAGRYFFTDDTLFPS